jgi:hypothetical protein
LSNEQLLRRARSFFDIHGFIPFDLAAQLIARGYDVQGIERKWTEADD